MANFFSQYGLFIVLALLLVFMVFSTRRRTKRMKEEQEKKATQTVPGARVLLQGGLYGTVVEFDQVNLDRPARIEIAPGVIIEVHSQAILRIVDEENHTIADDSHHTPLDDHHAPLDDRHAPLDERHAPRDDRDAPRDDRDAPRDERARPAEAAPVDPERDEEIRIESAEETRARLKRESEDNS